MSVNDRKVKIYLAFVLLVLSASYFLLSYNRFLNPEDEGYLLYNFSKFARGQLPHRDFYDIYGALTYVVGGTLFKIFGYRIIALRLFVVFLKVGMTLLLFIIGAGIMPPFFAFLGSVIFILCWGDPLLPLYGILYGSHMVHLLALIGILLILLYLKSGRKTWVFLAGLCAGVAVLFKLPSGVFLLLAFGLFLCMKEQYHQIAADQDATPDQVHIERLLRAIKIFIPFGAAILFIFYFSKFELNISYFTVFLLPFFLFLGLLLSKEISIFRLKVPEANGRKWASMKAFLSDVSLLGLGGAIPFLLQVAFYYQAGGLQEMFYDTFVLPSSINYFSYLDRAGLIASFLVGAFLFSIFLSYHDSAYLNRKAIQSLFLLAVVVFPLAITLYALAFQVRYRTWHSVVITGLSSFTLVLAFPFIMRMREDSAPAIHQKLALYLVYSVSMIFLMMGFPRSDEAHFAANQTIVFLLIGFVLWKTGETAEFLFENKRRFPRMAFSCLLLLPIVFPLLWSMKILLIPSIPPEYQAYLAPQKQYPYLQFSSERAGGLRLPLSRVYTPPLSRFTLKDMDQTIDFIQQHSSPNDRIFVISEQQVIYFLAGRDSILPKDNYFIYLSSYEFVNPETPVKLTDGGLLQQLKDTKPLYVVQESKDRETYNFMITWPRSYSYIQAAYTPVAEFGTFQVLQLRDLDLMRKNNG